MTERFEVRSMEYGLFTVVDTYPRVAINEQDKPYTCTAYVMAAGLTHEEAQARADFLNRNPQEAA